MKCTHDDHISFNSANCDTSNLNSSIISTCPPLYKTANVFTVKDYYSCGLSGKCTAPQINFLNSHFGLNSLFGKYFYRENKNVYIHTKLIFL